MNQQPVSPGGPQGGSSTMKQLLIILVVVIVLGGGYLLYNKYGKASTTTASLSPASTIKASPSTSAAVSPSASSTVPADWKTYTNDNYKFQLTFTDDWKGFTVKSQPEDKVYQLAADDLYVLVPSNIDGRDLAPVIIWVYTLANWDKQNQEAAKPIYFGKTDNYAFAYTLAPLGESSKYTDQMEALKNSWKSQVAETLKEL